MTDFEALQVIGEEIRACYITHVFELFDHLKKRPIPGISREVAMSLSLAYPAVFALFFDGAKQLSDYDPGKEEERDE